MSSKDTHSPQNLYSTQDKDIKVSLFVGGKKAVNPKQHISINTISKIALSKEQQDLTSKTIAETDSEKQQILKAKSPFITPYGTFSYRNNESIITHNCRIVAFDFDQMQTIEVIKLISIFIANKSCVLCFKSPRQKGVKALFLISDAIPLEKHYDTLKANAAALLQGIGAIEFIKFLDNSQFVLCQPLYLSYDPNFYENLTPEPLQIKLIAPQEIEFKSYPIREWSSTVSQTKKRRILAYINIATDNLCMDLEFETGARHPNIAKVKGIAGLIKMYSLPNEAEIYERLENSIVIMYGSESEAKAGNAYKSMRDAWEAAEPLYNETIETILNEQESENPFPIDVIPQPFKEYIINLKETVNYPIDYTGTALLTAAATAAGTNFKVLVKAGWIENGSLFTCMIGNAGANKTHPINTMFAPIKAIDKERHDQFKYAYEIYSSYEKLPKKDKDEAESLFAPTLEKSVLSNFTTEILFKRLSENPRGCTVLSDELISFLEGMNNYSKSDQIGFYLSVWSNQSTTVDRVGQPIPLFISNPYLSIIGGLQPRALNKAFPIDKLNNGFFQRFLFAYPENVIKQPLNDNVANEQLAQKYEAFINKLFEIDGPRTLTFTTAAKRYFYEWQSDNCDRVNEHQNSIKGEILSKFDNHFIRLALLLQIMSDPDSMEISIEAVEASKALCDYYLNCAFKILAKIQNKENYLTTLPQEKQQLFSELGQEFSTAEAMEAGADVGMNERTIRRFLQDTQLFKKVSHGNYLKKEIKTQ